MVTFTLMIIANKKIDLLFKHVPYIYYPLYFKKNKSNIKALINFNNEVNAITSIYIAKLGLKVYITNVKA